jgi:hypothetical protein
VQKKLGYLKTNSYLCKKKIMNIFVLDKDPVKCAIYHNNKHCIKQLLETSQLLCGVHHVTNSNLDVPYKLTHKNHPCSIWARECMENYEWLCELGLSLAKEYTSTSPALHMNGQSLNHTLSNILPISLHWPPPSLASGDQ